MSEDTKSLASSSSNTNTEVGITPHTSTVRSDAWVSFHKFGEGDLIVAGKLAAHHAFGCEMKLFTVRHHTWLRGLQSLNAIACRCSCCGLRCGYNRSNRSR